MNQASNRSKLIATELDLLLALSIRETAAVFAKGDIPRAIAYYSVLRDEVKTIDSKLNALQEHLDGIDELIQTMVINQTDP